MAANNIIKHEPIEERFREQCNHPLLTNDQVIELAQRIKDGDNDARKKLYQCNFRFVISVARQYKDKGYTIEELISFGNKGLERAALKYTKEKDFGFLPYALYFIREEIKSKLT
mgnify:CR=1 FL=1